MIDAATIPVGAVSAPPRGMLCPACLYDLSGSLVPCCSECGRRIDDADVRRFFLRRTAREDAHRMALQQFGASLAIAVLMGLGAAFILREWGAGAGACVMCWIAGLLSIGAGWLVAALSPVHERWAWRVAWLRTHWVLHVPWLCIPMWAATLLMMAFLEYTLRYDSGGAVLGLTIALGFSFWLGLLLWVLVRWGNAWGVARRELLLDHPRTAFAHVILGACVLMCASLLGLAGGIATVAGAHDWFGPKFGF